TAVANRCDRAPRRTAGAMAGVPVHRDLDAHHRVPAHVARAAARTARRREGNGDAPDAAPPDRRDYALLRAAMSETNFPWQSTLAGELAPSVRVLADGGTVTTAEALAYLEREHGLIGIGEPRLACRPRAGAPAAPSRDGALARAPR